MLGRRKQPDIPRALGGVIAAAITPRRRGEVEVDLGAMLELMDFLGDKRVQGILLFGTTGEFVHFTLEERSRYVALLAKRSRLPIVANVSHSTLDGAISLAEQAAGAGIAAVSIMPPYYFRYSAETIETFLLKFADHVAKWVPVLLYNIPAFTGPIPIGAAQRLAATGLFMGIKDSSGDWENMRALLAIHETAPFTVLSGDDALYARARQAGAAGGVSGVACAVPELMAALDGALSSGAEETVRLLDARLSEFLAAIDPLPVPAGIRAAVEARGTKAGPAAAPPGPEGEAQFREFRRWFDEWLPPVLGECANASRI